VRAIVTVMLKPGVLAPARARATAEDMARKLLANTVIEGFHVEIAS